MQREVAIAILLAILLARMPNVDAQYFKLENILLEVYENGIASVRMEFKVFRNFILNVTLIGEVLEEIGLIVEDENGFPLYYNLTDKGISVYVVDASEVHITYYTQTLTSMNNGVWRLEYSSEYNVSVILPEGSTILDMSTVPLQIDLSGEKPIFLMPAGEQYIEYTIPIYVTSSVTTTQETETTSSSRLITSTLNETTTTSTTTAPSTTSWSTINETQTTSTKGKGENTTSETTQTSTSETSGSTKTEVKTTNRSEEEEATGFPWIIILSTIILLTVVGGIVIYLTRRRKIGVLRSEEIMVLEAIKKRGGRCYQYEIASEIGLPKTTLWRILRRLERMGYLEIRKVRGYNYLVLK